MNGEIDKYTKRSLRAPLVATARATESSGATLANSDARLVIIANKLVDLNTAVGLTNTKLDAVVTALAGIQASLTAIQASAANLKPNGAVSGIIATVA